MQVLGSFLPVGRTITASFLKGNVNHNQGVVWSAAADPGYASFSLRLNAPLAAGEYDVVFIWGKGLFIGKGRLIVELANDPG